MTARKKTILLAASILLLFGFALEAVAEVAARTDRRGNYMRLRVTESRSSTNRPLYWTAPPSRMRVGRMFALNPGGDVHGDLAPTAVESPVAPYHPWVTWSRFNGVDYDLAFSRWTQGGWTSIEWIEPKPTRGNDLDPVVVFDEAGRPYMVWQRQDGGPGQVLFSMFLAERWMTPFVVSQEDVDSWSPSFETLRPGEITVTYETPYGTASQAVVFDDPVTITDDINPTVLLHGAVHYAKKGN